MIQTDDILFDPKDAEYFHKNSPDKKVNANEISVVESSIELFEEISFSDLIAFESQLFDDITFAKEHPVGARIYEIIDGWKEFIDFDMPTYFHARALNDSGQAYLDQEMLKAPQNISGHGRYNDVLLDVEQEDISLAIVYSSNKIQEYNDGSEIFGRYYEEGEKVLQVYIETEPCQ